MRGGGSVSRGNEPNLDVRCRLVTNLLHTHFPRDQRRERDSFTAFFICSSNHPRSLLGLLIANQTSSPIQKTITQ